LRADGRPAVNPLAATGRFGFFGFAVAWRALTPPWETHALAHHVLLVTGRCALPVVATVMPFGMVMALQGLSVFELFGAQRMLSALVSVAVFRELSPVLSSVLVAAQGGSAFAAELGAMRIKEELDATEVMAVDSLRVHVVPRVLAVIVAAPILNLAGSLSGIFGGWITAVLVKGENSGIYWSNLWALTHLADIWGGALKTVVFGALIGLIATYQGYNARGGAAGVGTAVNNTVVYCITAMIIANYLLTSALFGAIR
jgi:phospholipid/cholesterol/gamma-HCH transport system permease protein